MPRYSFPNQRTINIHREAAKADFLGIKNINWQSAAVDLGAHALMLYLYLASNANGYSLSLSPAAIEDAIGMPRSTYHDQFRKLIRKGYLVEASGNIYDFFEQPQPRHAETQNSMSAVVDENKEVTALENEKRDVVQDIPTKDIQINNKQNKPTDNKSINKEEPFDVTKYIPKPVIVTIPRPQTDKKEFNF